MSNVHRLGDYDNNNQNNQYGGQNNQPQFQGNQRANDAFQNQPILGGMGQQQTINPRQETFCHMLKFTFCPTFSIKSFIFLITVVDILLFIMTLCWTMFSGEYALDPTQFLGPSVWVLLKCGAKWDPYILCENEVWRFFTPMFLHGGFVHIFSNMVSQLVIGFMLESIMGPFRTAALYFASGIGGVIFSCLCSTGTISVGASTAIFGLLGGFLAMIIVNWKAFDRNPEVRCCIIIMIVFMLLFSLLYSLGVNQSAISSSVQGVDVYGHIGGFLTGLFFGMIIMVHLRGPLANQRMSFEKKIQIIGGILLFLFLILTVPILFTYQKDNVCGMNDPFLLQGLDIIPQ